MTRKLKGWLFASLLIAGGVSLFASNQPDGYEKVAEAAGFIDKAENMFHAPLPKYAFAGWELWMSKSLAGIIGVFLTFGTFLLIGRWMKK